jgi:GTPase SAR1 family protein
MKIAIIGPAGSGKSTITRLMKATSEYGDDYTKVIECDKEVNEIYDYGNPLEPVVRFALKSCPKCMIACGDITREPGVFGPWVKIDKKNSWFVSSHPQKRTNENRESSF